MARPPRLKQKGIVTLTVVSAVLIATTLMTTYNSKSVAQETKLTRNYYAAKQAFEAAEAGLEYGRVYLDNHKRILLQPDQQGQQPLLQHTLQMTLQNQAKYTVHYSFPNVNDESVVKITSTGSSNLGAVNKVMSVQVKYKPDINAMWIPKVPLTGKGPVELNGTPKVSNPCHRVAVWSGKQVQTKGAAKIQASDTDGVCIDQQGKGKGKNSNSGIQQNNTSLANSTADQFFMNYFGMSKEVMQKDASERILYGDSGTEINGLKQKIIWINGDYRFEGNKQVGSSNQPVILIVNGNFTQTGKSKIYGFVYVAGNYESGIGTSEIHGTLAAEGSITINGTAEIVYDADVLKNVSSEQGKFVMIPGSWIDL